MVLEKLKILLSIFALITLSVNASDDLNQIVSGSETEDFFGKIQNEDNTSSPYLILSTEDHLAGPKSESIKKEDVYLPNSISEQNRPESPKQKFQDFGYTPTGSLEGSENYLEIDKKNMSYQFRRISSGGINVTYVKNSYQYDSSNDIINKTIGEGYKHIKGGALHVRGDQYLFHTFLLNGFWSVGLGAGYNSGRGLFVSGERSDATFRLWEVPVDVALGLEIPIYHWFKIVGTAGPSVLGLYQNRSDFKNGEAGKNKTQVSYGTFANGQFKINLSGFSNDLAYDLFTSSRITNLFLNLEVRYQKYQNFQDPIKVSGSSFGVGFTFEYL